jgi:hypothetical protein
VPTARGQPRQWGRISRTRSEHTQDEGRSPRRHAIIGTRYRRARRSRRRAASTLRSAPSCTDTRRTSTGFPTRPPSVYYGLSGRPTCRDSWVTVMSGNGRLNDLGARTWPATTGSVGVRRLRFGPVHDEGSGGVSTVRGRQTPAHDA